MVTPSKVIRDACRIIELAGNDYSEFATNYSDCRISSGEREFDGAMYGINLSEDYTLVIETSKNIVRDFEVRSKSVVKKLATDELYNVWYPI